MVLLSDAHQPYRQQKSFLKDLCENEMVTRRDSFKVTTAGGHPSFRLRRFVYIAKDGEVVQVYGRRDCKRLNSIGMNIPTRGQQHRINEKKVITIHEWHGLYV